MTWNDVPISTLKKLDVKDSRAFDISEYMQKQNQCKSIIIGFLMKETDKAVQIKEAFGYQRTMWFPKAHIQMTPQSYTKMTPDKIERYCGKDINPIERKKHLLGGVWDGDEQIVDADGKPVKLGEALERYKRNQMRKK